MKHNRGRVALALALAGTLVFAGVPSFAFADKTSSQLQSEVDAALQTLQSYSSELELASNELYQLQEDLDAVKEEIEQTEQDIEEKEADLAEGQEELSQRLTETYKQNGSNGMLSFVLGTTDFEELVVRVFYADRLADYDSQLLETVKTTKQELEEKRTQLEEDKKEQEQLVEDQQAKTEEIKSKVSEQQAYYNSLDSELQAQLAAEAEARQRAAEEAARKAEEERQQQESQQQDSSSDNGANDSVDDSSDDDTDSTPSGGSNNRPSTPSGGSSNNNTNSGSAPSGVVDIALAQVGKGYEYAGSGPNVFDCSGLTSYAYGQAGYSIPHSSQAQYNLVAGAGHLVTSTSALKPGDLVFWGYGGRGSSIYHVGIYIGGGQYVHAAYYGIGVTVTTLGAWDASNYVGGGSPF